MSRKQLYPLVSVDVALFCVEDGQLKVLLVRRAQDPARHAWALPGGLIQPEGDASLEGAALRVLRDKIDVHVEAPTQVATFSGPGRDPRGWSMATLFYALLPRDHVQAVEKHKVEQLEWTDAHDPGRALAFDHSEQLASAVGALQQRVSARQLPLHLLPQEFTLTQLQRTCEAILRRDLDKSVFRRRLMDSADLVDTGRLTEGGRQRPARLFSAAEEFRWG